MKKITIVLLLILTVGCGKVKEKTIEEKIIGTWETKYTLSAFGEITESYIFKEKGKCIRMLYTGTDIVNECTYELNEEKDKIRIIWENKLNKENYDKLLEIDENNIMIAEHKYTRKKD